MSFLLRGIATYAWAAALLLSSASQPRAAGEPSQPPSEATGPGIRGKALFEGKPAAGVALHAYTDPATDFKGSGLGSSGPTAADGRFFLGLKPGRYFLIGRGAGTASTGEASGVGELFGYYGGNPVKIPEGAPVEVNLQLVRRAPLTVVAAGQGPDATVEGVISGPRGPEDGALLFAYANAASEFRGPDLTGPQGSLVGGTGPDGRFSIELPPGTYYLTAAKRRGGNALGPLQVGDLYGYFDGNPLRIQAGQRASLTLQMTEKLRQADSRAVAQPGTTGIRGRLLDRAGSPVAGVFAFATTDANLIGAMPPHRSRPAGADGAYFIELPRGGTFFVGARSGFGGPPQPGQWQGMLGDANIRTVTVGEGQVLDGVDITVQVVE